MKTLMTTFLSLLTSLLVFSQAGNNTVTINYNGQNKQVLIDGKVYAPTSNLQIITTDLAPGRHTLQVVRNNNRRNTETSFTLRRNYDMNITIAGNGSIQLKETYRRAATTSTGIAPMSNSEYNRLVAEVKALRTTSAKINALNAAFANTSNYFNTTQIRKLILLVNGETFRLQLAKASVRAITDTRNAYGLTNVLASQASRNDLTNYIRSYTAGQTAPAPTGEVAMSTASFNTLFTDIRDRWQPGAKFSAVSNAFTTYYFTTSQAMQLIQLLSSESERLQLAKASYARITDKANFSQMANLLGTQASRDELAYYVNTGNIGTPSTPTANTGVAMSDANFTSVLQQVRSLWLPGAKKREILSLFANTSNNFTVNQVVQLIQLDSDETDRLDMAKASLRSIVDPQNMPAIYGLFSTQARKDEMLAYIRAYNGNYSSSTTGTTMNPMDETRFRTLYEETRRLWLPGATKASVLNTFNTQGNYFTTAQVMQLIQLDNDEPDRLDMAKAAYKVVTDKNNFSQVNGLFTNQGYINELAAYVRANP